MGDGRVTVSCKLLIYNGYGQKLTVTTLFYILMLDNHHHLPYRTNHGLGAVRAILIETSFLFLNLRCSLLQYLGQGSVTSTPPRPPITKTTRIGEHNGT
jgi:hypothetical protein